MNKLTKVLSVFVLAGAIGAGMTGIAGCGHQHTFSEKWDGQDANQHWHKATCEHTDVKGSPADHVDANNDGKCDVCEYVMSTGSSIALPAGVNDLIVEGVTTEYVLSSTVKSANIPLTGFDVYFATGKVKGDKVPAANWKATLYKGGTTKVEDTTALKEDAAYTLSIELVNVTGGETIMKDVPIVVKNPITAVALKTGTTTQAQSATNSMVPTWTFEATRANGDKEDVAASEITVSSIDTTKAGTGSATLTYKEQVLGSVDYEITADAAMVQQSFAMNFSNLTDQQKADVAAGEEITLQNGRFVFKSVGSGSIDSHNKSVDGKYFANRLKTNGASTANNATRYIKVKADGAATLTVYAYNNSSTAGRGVSVYSSADLTGTAAVFPDAAKVGETKVPEPKTDTKLEFTLPAAGEYYITNDAAMCYTYVQLDQLVSSTDNEKIDLAGNVVVSKLSAKYSGEGEHHVNLGTTFDSVKSSYTVKATGVNDVTCESNETDVTADCQFDVPADFTTVPGSKTITVSYSGKTDVITIIVDSAVAGISGVTANILSTVDLTVASGASLTLNKTDIKVDLVGENAEAAVESFIVKDGNNEVTFPATLPVGDYTYTVVATVKAGAATATLTAELSFKVSVKAEVSTLENVEYGSKIAALSAKVTYTANTDLVNNASGRIFIVAANGENQFVDMESNSKSYDSLAFKNRIKTGGKGTTEYRSIGFEVKAGCTIVVYCMSSSSSAERDVNFLSSDGTVIKTVKTTGVSKALDKFEFTVTAAGTYYVASNEGGLNVYGMEIVYKAAPAVASLEALPPKQEN